MERLQFNSKAAEAVQAYIEYENIVGGADGGKLLSPAEYEEFKKQVASQRANRLFVYWTNSSGLECKTIGPHSKCFCNHRYKEHQTDKNIASKKVPCKVPRCPCGQFSYVPVYGSNDLKCLCKHSYKEHNPQSKKCTRPNCRCSGFSSTHSCSCSRHFNDHSTQFFTKQERVAMGKPVDTVGGEMNAAMGGLTDFSSLLDGVEREQLGQGRAIEEAMVQPRGKRVNALDLYNTPHKFA